jgi:lipopolysaccharide export system permease protein
MTGAVFTLVLLIGNLFREILPLLISGRATFGLMLQAFGLLIPFLWTFALPMGMLTATLLVFGRFSADQELTAARASGVSLLSLVTPILLLSLVFCGISALVNLEIGPRCRLAYIGLRSQLTSVLINSQLPEGRPITDFPGFVVYVGKNRKQQLSDVRIYRFENETNLTQIIRATGGRIRDNTTNEIVLDLFDVKSLFVQSGVSGASTSLQFSLKFDQIKKIVEADITDMTFSQLLERQRELEHRVNLPLPRNPSATNTVAVKARDLKKYRADITVPIRVQIHRRVAFSFACFGFTLIGIPLGIRVHRRETNIGIAVALGLVSVYYALIVIGEALSSHPEFAPHLWMWLPNFVFQAVGAVLLWRANRGI